MDDTRSRGNQEIEVGTETANVGYEMVHDTRRSLPSSTGSAAMEGKQINIFGHQTMIGAAFGFQPSQANHITRIRNVALLLAVIFFAGCRSFANEGSSCDWAKPDSAESCTPAQMSTNGTYASLNSNSDLAIDWYRKAAEAGNAEGQASLAIAYFQGRGVEKDYKQAANWWQKSAAQGSSVAQINLALCYIHAEGVPRDYVVAYKWLLIADRSKNESVKKILEEFGKKLTTEQRMKAHSLADEWRPEATSTEK